jgi:aminoglycoside phosphotransferase (APT) family kinase protein
MNERTSRDLYGNADHSGGDHVVAWVERELGGTVVSIERLPRWRPAWWIDLQRGDELVRLYGRGERGADFPSPFSLAHEVVVHDTLERHGVPVPHAYGIVEDGPLRVLVMDRMPGQQGLALADADVDRQALLLDWVDYMVKMHEIDVAELGQRGIPVPSDPASIAMSAALANVEQIYLSRDHVLDPVIEFLRGWLRRNQPTDRHRATFVAWDSAQFLYDGGTITALIDFELAHVGDAYMDLAPLRSRDTMEPLGDLSVVFDRYSRLTGQVLDYDILRYFEISQLTTSAMLAYCTMTAPAAGTDLVSHMTWYSDSVRYALEAMAELDGDSLEIVPVPPARSTRRAAAHRHLVDSLRRKAGHESIGNLVRFGVDVGPTAPPGVVHEPFQGFAAWRDRCDYRLARHLSRADEIGPEVDAQDLADVSDFLGTGVGDLAEGDAALRAAIASAAGSADAELKRLFARRIQRFHMMLGPADSLVVRHPPMQPLPDRRQASGQSGSGEVSV